MYSDFIIAAPRPKLRETHGGLFSFSPLPRDKDLNEILVLKVFGNFTLVSLVQETRSLRNFLCIFVKDQGRQNLCGYVPVCLN